jgi:DNA-directed RNA polymerase specialized sigma24 family protein
MCFSAGQRTEEKRRERKRVATKAKSEKPSKSNQLVSAEERIARTLGLLLVKDVEKRTDQVTLLRSIGFEVSDVAAMLGMTENHVNQAAFQGRKKSNKKGA